MSARIGSLRRFGVWIMRRFEGVGDERCLRRAEMTA